MSRLSTKPIVKIIVPTKSNKKSELSCSVCHKLFKIKRDMLKHICIDPEKRPYVCEQCGQRFKSRNRLESHTSYKHDALDEDCIKFPCLHCGKYFKAAHHLKLHLAITHGEKKFVCEVEGCGKKFTQRDHLQQHYLAHVEYKPFRCKLCGKTFKLLQFLKRHSEVHKGNATFAPKSEVNTRLGDDSDCDSEDDLPERLIRVWTCHICGKHFTRNFNLKQHLERHKNRCFPCEVCDPEIKFKTVAERKEHYDSVHSGKPFSCQVCEYKTGMKCNLIKHLKVVHCKKQFSDPAS